MPAQENINPLSCFRCKAKKIKCGREEPKCDKCKATRSDCSYPTRRQRNHAVKKRANILSEILQRLDTIERKIGLTSPNAPKRLEDVTSRGSLDGNSTHGDEDDRSDSEGAPEENEPLFTSIYHLMNEAASTTKDVLDGAPETISPDHKAEDLFKDAVASIRTFRWMDDDSSNSLKGLDVPPDLAVRWVDLCFDYAFYGQILGPEVKPLMRVMPTIINSPVVDVSHAAIVVYYNVLLSGWRIDQLAMSQEMGTFGRRAYRECLKILPAWKNDGLPATIMDLIATGLMSLLAIENFDYHLGWDLHLVCCQSARELKIDHLDDPDPSKRPEGYDDEAKKDDLRTKFWQLIHMEFFFRLYYDKPATMTGTDFKVNFPSNAATSDSVPPADAIYFLVNSRCVFALKEFFDLLNEPPSDLEVRVQRILDQIEGLIIEWNLYDRLTALDEHMAYKWMYADLMVNAYITVILVDRKTKAKLGVKSKEPPLRSVVAARKSLEVLSLLTKVAGNQYNFLNFVSFYPFIAFFTLYQHILFTIQQQRPKVEQTQLNQVQKDIVLMEELAGLMNTLSVHQEEFRLVADAVGALIEASRHLISTSQLNSPASNALPTPTASQLDVRNRDLGAVSGNTLNTISNMSFDWTSADGLSWPQFEAELQRNDLSAPLSYIESLESDFLGKNWHQSWWDQ